MARASERAASSTRSAGPTEGEDGAVVVGVAVLVEKGGASRGGQPGHNGLVAALADIDDALDEHVVSVARRRRLPAQPSGGGARSERARRGLLGDDGV